ncbi:MAG: translation initiation factor IF-3 [Candidatus Atribacteria bacterium]|nr:translation initiation factor IF-3 [Candidatus Atribacteria bacterium]
MHIEVKFRVNYQIKAREVRLLSYEGEQLGVVPVKKALELAEEAGFDLVEIAPDADPPVCRIVDFGKFKYEKEKKAKSSRKKQKVSELKELKMRPKIDEHDYQVKLKSALRFLQDGDRVKLTIRFRGRESAYANQGVELLHKMIEDLGEMSKVEQEIKNEGRNLTMTIAPRK